MAVTQQVHPRLQQLEEERLAAEKAPVEDAPTEPVTPEPEAPPEPAAEAAPVPSDVVVPEPETTPEEDEFVTVRFPKNAKVSDVEAAIGGNPHLENLFRTQVGRKAKREYEPKLQTLQTELAQLRAEKLQQKVAAVPAEQVGERLRTDPEFRREYEAAQRQTPQAIQARSEFAAAIDEIAAGVSDDAVPEVVDRLREGMVAGDYDFNVENGQRVPLNPQRALGVFGREVNAYSLAASSLPDDIRDRYHSAFSSGWYSVRRGPDEKPILDALGNPQPVGNREAVLQITAAMRRYSEYARTQAKAAPVAAAPAPAAQVQQPVAAAPAEAPKPAPVANPALTAAAPDLTPPATSRGVGRMTYSEYSALTPPERLKAAPRGLDAALKDGSIYRT